MVFYNRSENELVFDTIDIAIFIAFITFRITKFLRDYYSKEKRQRRIQKRLLKSSNKEFKGFKNSKQVDPNSLKTRGGWRRNKNSQLTDEELEEFIKSVLSELPEIIDDKNNGAVNNIGIGLNRVLIKLLVLLRKKSKDPRLLRLAYSIVQSITTFNLSLVDLRILMVLDKPTVVAMKLSIGMSI
jgi:hypothetical protein